MSIHANCVVYACFRFIKLSKLIVLSNLTIFRFWWNHEIHVSVVFCWNTQNTLAFTARWETFLIRRRGHRCPLNTMHLDCIRNHVRGPDFGCFVRICEKFGRPFSPKIGIWLTYLIFSSKILYQIERAWARIVFTELFLLALVIGFLIPQLKKIIQG